MKVHQAKTSSVSIWVLVKDPCSPSMEEGQHQALAGLHLPLAWMGLGMESFVCIDISYCSRPDTPRGTEYVSQSTFNLYLLLYLLNYPSFAYLSWPHHPSVYVLYFFPLTPIYLCTYPSIYQLFIYPHSLHLSVMRRIWETGSHGHVIEHSWSHLQARDSELHSSLDLNVWEPGVRQWTRF